MFGEDGEACAYRIRDRLNQKTAAASFEAAIVTSIGNASGFARELAVLCKLLVSPNALLIDLANQ